MRKNIWRHDIAYTLLNNLNPRGKQVSKSDNRTKQRNSILAESLCCEQRQQFHVSDEARTLPIDSARANRTLKPELWVLAIDSKLTERTSHSNVRNIKIVRHSVSRYNESSDHSSEMTVTYIDELLYDNTWLYSVITLLLPRGETRIQDYIKHMLYNRISLIKILLSVSSFLLLSIRYYS